MKIPRFAGERWNRAAHDAAKAEAAAAKAELKTLMADVEKLKKGGK